MYICPQVAKIIPSFSSFCTSSIVSLRYAHRCFCYVDSAIGEELIHYFLFLVKPLLSEVCNIGLLVDRI